MKNSLNSEQLGHFIQRIYQSVQNPALLSAIVADLGRLIEAQYCALQVENFDDHSLGFADLIGYEEQAIESYSDYFITRDPWMAVLKAREPNSQMFVASHQYLTDKVYRQSEFYSDWGKINKVRHAMGTALELDNGSYLKLSFQRHADRGQFEDSVIAFLNQLYPHFKALVQLSGVFRPPCEPAFGWQQQLQSLHRPAWLLTAKAELLFQNQRASDFSYQHPELQLQQRRLCFGQQQDALLSALKQLQTQVTQALQAKRKGVQILTLATTKTKVRFCLMPFARGPELEKAYLLLGPKQVPSLQLLIHSFSLTKREAEFCLCLMQGSELAAIAAELGISINTCRNMLAACFKKLACRNQAELILKLFNCYS